MNRLECFSTCYMPTSCRISVLCAHFLYEHIPVFKVVRGGIGAKITPIPIPLLNCYIPWPRIYFKLNFKQEKEGVAVKDV